MFIKIMQRQENGLLNVMVFEQVGASVFKHGEKEKDLSLDEQYSLANNFEIAANASGKVRVHVLEYL